MIYSVAALMARGLSARSGAAQACIAAHERAMAEQRMQLAECKSAPKQERWDASRKDFWNDPDRWEGINPHVECFWMRRRRDVIDVREALKPAPNPYTNMAAQSSHSLQNALSALNAGNPYNTLGSLYDLGSRV